MILLIDNYDSFTYNLVQLLEQLNHEVAVFRNDQIELTEIEALNPSALMVSPGPGTPADSGVSLDAIRQLGPTIPVFGVCLGHQAIAAVFGGKVLRAQRIMHGKTSRVDHDGKGIFDGIPSPLTVARYHSLMAVFNSSELVVTARSNDGVIMGLHHPAYPLHGVQFHPESFLTEQGAVMINNFLNIGLSIGMDDEAA